MTGYLDRLIAAINAGHLTPGEAVQVDVAHGPGCPRKPCTCHPSVTVIRQHETLVIGDHGHVLERRSEEHTSELPSLMRISYAAFCSKKKQNTSTLPPLMLQ